MHPQHLLVMIITVPLYREEVPSGQNATLQPVQQC
jgi:hypothetical protein